MTEHLDCTRIELEQLRDTARQHGLAVVATDCDAALSGAASMTVLRRLQAAVDVLRARAARAAERDAVYQEAMARS